MSKQIFNSAWVTTPNSRVTYHKASLIVPTLKSLQRLLPNGKDVLQALIVLPLLWLLAVVLLSF